MRDFAGVALLFSCGFLVGCSGEGATSQAAEDGSTEPGPVGSGGTAGAGGGAPASKGGSAGSGVAPTDAATDAAPESSENGARDSGDAGLRSFCGAREGMRFCDDFESMAPTAPPSGAAWSVAVNGEGTVTVDDSTKAHSGNESIHVHGAGYSTMLVLHGGSVLPVSERRFYVRAYLRLADSMTAGHNTFVIADSFAMPGTGNTARIGEMNSMLMMTVAGDAHGALSNDQYYDDHLPGKQFQAGAWNCLELLFDAAHPELDVWVDENEVPDLHKFDWPIDDYDTLRFGFEKYEGPVSDIWYDDIAVSTQRIGCP